MPLGEVTMVPPLISGRSEAELARAMATALADLDEPSVSQVYGRLRQAFPLAPLGARVSALAALMEKIRRPAV
jgi:hypothetical protein